MDINTVTIVGRLTADPELRFTPGGTQVCTLRLASNRAPKDGKDQGAVFIDVVTFNRLAEAVAENLEKGRQVAITGRLEYRQWETLEGSPRSKHEIIANQVQFLARPASNGSSPSPPTPAARSPSDRPRRRGGRQRRRSPRPALPKGARL